MVWLAIVGVVAAVVGAFYYLRIVKVMYFDAPDSEPAAGEGPTAAADVQFRWLFSVNASLLLVLGLAWSPLMSWCQRAFGV
jgi:NADH-quinone oxidoreductase subunit N